MRQYRETEFGDFEFSGEFIPANQELTQYNEMLELISLGVAEIVPYIKPQLTVAEYRAAVGQYIDSEAQALGFDNIITAVTYADEPADPVNQAHGIRLRAWRSLCWEYCRDVLASGETPTIQELIEGLPTL